MNVWTINNERMIFAKSLFIYPIASKDLPRGRDLFTKYKRCLTFSSTQKMNTFIEKQFIMLSSIYKKKKNSIKSIYYNGDVPYAIYN